MRLPALERGPCSVSFGASNHHCSDVLDTRSAQGGGYGVQRGARGHHIVHQDHPLTFQLRRDVWFHHECVAQVVQTLRSIQAALRGSVMQAQQCMGVGFFWSQRMRDQRRLVEPPFAKPLPRQRNAEHFIGLSDSYLRRWGSVQQSRQGGSPTRIFLKLQSLDGLCPGVPIRHGSHTGIQIRGAKQAITAHFHWLGHLQCTAFAAIGRLCKPCHTRTAHPLRRPCMAHRALAGYVLQPVRYGAEET